MKNENIFGIGHEMMNQINRVHRSERWKPQMCNLFSCQRVDGLRDIKHADV